MSLKVYKTKPGESPCSVALKHGLDNCDRLELDNMYLPRDDETLPEGTVILLPQPESKLEEAVTEKLNSFELTQRQPHIEFIQDEKHGHNDPWKCNLDPVVTELAITNYVVDRGGDGLSKGNFPDETVFSWKKEGSDDPDHFKVQVLDGSVPDSVNELQVSLFAQMPRYKEKKRGADTVMEPKSTGHSRESDPKRSLLNVTCKRMGNTRFFRSPYLRLVTFEADRAKRPKQTLLVTDFVDSNYASKNVRNLTEILHQRIEAHYKIPSCGHKKCGVSAFADLADKGVIELAVHVLGDPTNADDQKTLKRVRKLMRTWTRRIYAAAGLRIELRTTQVVPLPKNVLFVGDSALKHRGRAASGKNAKGGKSEMEFRVNGRKVEVQLVTGETPAQTANRIISAIPSAHADLAGFTATKFQVDLLQFPDANTSAPFDILVFDAAGNPAEVTRARSTDDDKTSGSVTQGKQQLASIEGPKWWRGAHGDFLVSPVIAESSHQERALHWSHRDSQALNIYVVPQKRLISDPPNGQNPAALGRLGSVGSLKTTLGPAIFVGRDGIDVDETAIAHEMSHVLMHCLHASAPLKDAPGSGPNDPTCTELMEANEDTADTHDRARHISDAPIKAKYEVIEQNATSATRVLDGTQVFSPASSSVMETPVSRLMHFAAHFGVLHNRRWIRVEPEATAASTESEAA